VNGRSKVAVIGAGVSGLATAFWLNRAGIDVCVFEREDAPGGTMRTIRDDGWLVETGPNSALETTPLFGELIEALALGDQHMYADPASNRRYILRGGALHALPMSPPAFLATRLWTLPAKLRLLKEPFVGRAGHEESVAEFVSRRLGREFLDYAINPFVAGVYAGNPEELSVRAAFPKLYRLEEVHGGLIRGMIMGARERKRRAETAKDRAKMFAFRDGMEVFPAALCRALGDRVVLSARVDSVAPADAVRGEAPPAFRLRGHQGGREIHHTADVVVISTPAHAAAALMGELSPPTAGLLERIVYPPVAEVFLGYRVEQCPRPLDGFGFLVPARERRQILGTIWSSALFPGRAPAGHIALTTFVGGSRQPALLERDDAGLIQLVRDDLQAIMGVRGDPVVTRVARWARAIPQYTMGYQSILEGLERCEQHLPGLFFCGNFRGGIAVGDCLMSAEKVSGRIREYLNANPVSTTHR
jgi:oxygen-dependent protoporphyrinogen oxidase